MTIEDILNSLAGRGYADGSTWMQQPQTQPDGPPMPAGPQMQLQGGAMNGMPQQGMMPRHFAPRRLPQQAMDNANANASFNRNPPLPATMQPANLDNVLPPNTPQPSGMIGWRARQPQYLADLAPNAPQMGGNMTVASNGFTPFNGRY